MSLQNHVARAMAVRMLSEGAIRALHAHEGKIKRALLPYEIAEKFTTSMSIKDAWRIPKTGTIEQEQHADRVSAEVTALIKAKSCSVDMTNDESRANYDWHIFHSAIDFSYHAARRAGAGALEGDVFQ